MTTYVPLSEEMHQHLLGVLPMAKKLLSGIKTKVVINNAPVSRIALEVFGDRSYFIILEIMNDFHTGDMERIIIPEYPNDVIAALTVLKKLPKLTGRATGAYKSLDAASSPVGLVDFKE